jgi:hypothetical protein
MHAGDLSAEQDGERNMWGTLIPIVAIVGSFAIPITAIILDYRRRKLQHEERRAMIERGMQPPPLEDKEKPFLQASHRTPEERRQKSLHDGVILLFLGLGLGVGAFLLGYVFTESFFPDKFPAMLALGAAVLGFLGAGYLIYYAITRKPGGRSSMPE